MMYFTYVGKLTVRSENIFGGPMSGSNRTTEVITCRYCGHAKEDVTIETRFVYPAEIFPDQPPRIQSRNCSHYLDCNLQDKTVCTFAATSPGTNTPVNH